MDWLQRDQQKRPWTLGGVQTGARRTALAEGAMQRQPPSAGEGRLHGRIAQPAIAARAVRV